MTEPVSKRRGCSFDRWPTCDRRTRLKRFERTHNPGCIRYVARPNGHTLFLREDVFLIAFADVVNSRALATWGNTTLPKWALLPCGALVQAYSEWLRDL